MVRRPFGRPLRRVQAGNFTPALQRANQLLASGQYSKAASLFDQFANGALARNGPRAPWFFLQAGQAHLLAGHVPQGVAHIHKGLSLFAARGQFQRLNQSGMRFMVELKARGLTAEAIQIEGYIKTTLPAGFVPEPGTGMEKPKPILPTTCPGCGGPIRSAEVEWADEMTAECP
jgi:hypothetical protein